MKKRTLKDRCGCVYILTNDLYAAEGTYKFGVTINPIERKRIQSNSTPPTHPFYDVMVIFSTAYKDIENAISARFESLGWLLPHDGENGGCEWIRHADADEIIDVCKDMLRRFPGAEMCHNGRRYIFENGVICEKKLPNCRLDFLGIRDGDTVRCSDGMTFTVSNNKILHGGVEMSLSRYMNTVHPRSRATNQHNGYQYFYFKGRSLYDMWQQLTRTRK